MPTEIRTDPRKNFVPLHLPWILAVAALVVYCLTLQHWVSFYSLGTVAKLSGWDWRPQVYSPLTFLVTLPFRLLPASVIPLALNLFSAVCASLTLALLARSVALLPQDRTDAQRKREKSAFSFLTTRSAWLPPVLAVAVCGLQLTFWEQATNFSGEMFDLLIFAFVIWSLLEYRLDEKESRLFLTAFIYGAGITENWAMVGFLPIFLTAIIWIRGLAFFDLRFLFRMLVCGTIGLLLYLLLPLLAIASSKAPLPFWEILKLNLIPVHSLLKSILGCLQNPGVYLQYVSLVLAYLVPILVMSIRWKASFGDSSVVGTAIAGFILQIAHAAFLGIFIWLAFDPSQFSPRNWDVHLPLLTFYYFGALAIGYNVGYFLLIFGKAEVSKRPPRNPPPLQFLNKPIVLGVWLLAVVAIVGLTYRNTPLIHVSNDDILHKFAKLTEKNLPRTGGLLLSDDSYRLFLVSEALVQDGRGDEFVPLDTSSLTAPAYHHFLHDRYPQKWPDMVPLTYTNAINPVGLVRLLTFLSRSNDLYYLHPSFGYYFEQFYLEPHGLVYKMRPLPADTLLPARPDQNLVAENEKFWTHDAAPSLANVAAVIAPPDPNAPLSFGENILMRLHIPRLANQITATQLGLYYSRSLDFWGTELERTGQFNRAATNFETALDLNPDNAVAKINLAFNKKLLSGVPATMDPSQATTDQFGKYATWSDVLNANGPFDDPNYCFIYGFGLYRENNIHQSIDQFERVRELAPDFYPARYLLAQAYLLNHLPKPAMEALRDPLENPHRFSLKDNDESQLNFLVAAVDFQQTNSQHGIKMIDTEIARHPHDDALLSSAIQIFIVRGLLTNALEVINQNLKTDPTNSSWLYYKGYVSIQLKNYTEAITALDGVLKVQTNNVNALFNRAIANLDSGSLDAAKADYLRLQQAVSNAPAITYGLGEIAWREHDTNEAIRNYQLYLTHANTNSAEAKTIVERLKTLKP